MATATSEDVEVKKERGLGDCMPLGAVQLTSKELTQVRQLPKFNDLCIDAYLSSLCRENRKAQFAFVDTFLSGLLQGNCTVVDRHRTLSRWASHALAGFNVGDDRKLFVPWHVPGHWILAVVVLHLPLEDQLDVSHIRIWDSLGCEWDSVDTELRLWLRSHLRVSAMSLRAVQTYYPVPAAPFQHQSDGKSCGPAVCLYAQREARSVRFQPSVMKLGQNPAECAVRFCGMVLEMRKQVDKVLGSTLADSSTVCGRCRVRVRPGVNSHRKQQWSFQCPA